MKKNTYISPSFTMVQIHTSSMMSSIHTTSGEDLNLGGGSSGSGRSNAFGSFEWDEFVTYPEDHE